MHPTDEQGRHGLPIREFVLRERYRGQMFNFPSGRPPENTYAAGFQAGVKVALACAHEALLHTKTPEAFVEGSWSRGRAEKNALDPHRMPDLYPIDDANLL